MKLIKCTKSLFCKSITDDKADKFAKTFVAKATLQNQWNSCIGLWDNDLLGAVIVTFSKRLPKVANLQLLHTFSKHRGKNVGTSLMKYSLHLSIINQCEYFRVSAEPDAVPFYQKIGMKMLGMQKSKCQLSMFKIVNDDFFKGIYDIHDPIINKAVYKKGKGGCIKIFV